MLGGVYEDGVGRGHMGVSRAGTIRRCSMVTDSVVVFHASGGSTRASE